MHHGVVLMCNCRTTLLLDIMGGFVQVMPKERSTKRAKKGKKTTTHMKIEFFTKTVFSQFRLKLGRSRGVRGEGTDHTKTLSRTLAGFGLTWHRKVHFSTFDGKLEGNFMTKYLQIGFWISPKARGFWLNGLRRKSILKNDPPKKAFARE